MIFFDLIHEQDWFLNEFGTALNNEDFIFHFINCLAFGAANTAENEDDVHKKIFSLLESYIREVTKLVADKIRPMLSLDMKNVDWS